MRTYIFNMATDERDFDLLTGRVLAAVFEVSNTLGSGFLEKVYERALLRELSLRGIQATPPSLIHSKIQRPLSRRIPCRYSHRRRIGSGAEMRGPARRRTHRAMSQLSAGLWRNSLSASQFSEAQGRMEAHRKRVFRLPNSLNRPNTKRPQSHKRTLIRSHGSATRPLTLSLQRRNRIQELPAHDSHQVNRR
jgi:hypothetical protein